MTSLFVPSARPDSAPGYVGEFQGVDQERPVAVARQACRATAIRRTRGGERGADIQRSSCSVYNTALAMDSYVFSVV